MNLSLTVVLKCYYLYVMTEEKKSYNPENAVWFNFIFQFRFFEESVTIFMSWLKKRKVIILKMLSDLISFSNLDFLKKQAKYWWSSLDNHQSKQKAVQL